VEILRGLAPFVPRPLIQSGMEDQSKTESQYNTMAQMAILL